MPELAARFHSDHARWKSPAGGALERAPAAPAAEGTHPGRPDGGQARGCGSPVPTWRGSGRRAVGVEHGEQLTQTFDVLVAEACANTRVELLRCRAQPQKGPLALLRELDALDAPVLGRPLTRHEPGALHRVEVVGEGRPLDPDGCRELTLCLRRLSLQREQDQPCRARAARLDERVVEDAAEALCGCGDGKADRLLT